MPPRRNVSEEPRPRPRLYLIAGPACDADALAQALGPAAAADVAAVLLRPPPSANQRDVLAAVQAVAPAVQNRGAALLIEGHAGLVARMGADGAHLAGFAALKAALPALKPDYIAGAGGLKTRHDAMLASEAGADYVMFGEPDAAGQRPSFPAVLERVAWWSEIFEPPCVGFAASLEELAALAQAGADFIALGDVVWNDAQGPAAVLTAAAERLRALELA